jgi:hypothetical protein
MLPPSSWYKWHFSLLTVASSQHLATAQPGEIVVWTQADLLIGR